MKGVISPLLPLFMFRWWKRKTQQPSKPVAWIRAGGIRGPFNPSELCPYGLAGSSPALSTNFHAEVAKWHTQPP